MRINQDLILKFEGPVSVIVDLSKVSMTEEQNQIVAKLISQLQETDLLLNSSDKCDEGNCLASQYLKKDEFAKIRDLKALLNPSDTTNNVIAEFCVKVWAL